MLVGLRIGLDADHRRRCRCERGRTVTLTAGHVDHAQALDARGDPLVDGEVAPIPVVLGRARRAMSAHRSARAAARPAAGSPGCTAHRHRRHGNVIAAMQALRSHEHIRDVNTPLSRRRRGQLRREVGHRLRRDRPGSGAREGRKLLGRGCDRSFENALEIGAGTGYFSLNLMRAGLIEELTCTDISSGDARRAARQRTAARARARSAAVQADAEALPVPRRELRPRRRPCDPPPPPGPGPRLLRV